MSFETDLRALLDDYLAAYAAQDAEACAGFYGNEAGLYSPFGAPALGRAEIRAIHAEWFTTGEDNKRLDILSADARESLGYALLRYSADTAEGVEAGTSLNVLECTSAGQWLFRFTSLNSDFKTTAPERDIP